MSIKGVGVGGNQPIRPTTGEAAEAKPAAEAAKRIGAKPEGDEFSVAKPPTGLGALLGPPGLAPGEDRSIKLNPGEEQGIRFAPGEDRAVKIKPGEEQGIRFAPGEDRGIKLNPGEEQGIRFAPGEDRAVKITPEASSWGDPHVQPAGAGEVRSTGLSPSVPENVMLKKPNEPAGG